MEIKGMPQARKRLLRIGAVGIEVADMALRTTLKINENILNPAEPKRNTKGEWVTDYAKMPEYDAKCQRLGHARLVALFYFMVKDSPDVDFHVEERALETIDAKWALELLEEVSEGLGQKTYSEIVQQIIELNGLNEDEFNGAEQSFLAEQD